MEKSEEEIKRENEKQDAKMKCMMNGVSEETLNQCDRLMNDGTERHNFQQQIIMSLARGGYLR